MKKTKIIFGNACYMIDNTIRIRQREWNRPLPSGKSWKQPYVAYINLVNDELIRTFVDRTEKVINGTFALEFNVDPSQIIEFGWVYNNMDSHDADTHYLIHTNGIWKEIDKQELLK